VDGQPVKLVGDGRSSPVPEARVSSTACCTPPRGPAVAYMLLLIGLFGIVFELYFPGIGAAALMGGGGVRPLALRLQRDADVVGGAGAGRRGHRGVRPRPAQRRPGHPHGVRHGGAGGGQHPAVPARPLRHFASRGGRSSRGVAGTLLFFISIMTAAPAGQGWRARRQASRAWSAGVGLARTDLVPDGEVTAAGSLWRARTLGGRHPPKAPGCAVRLGVGAPAARRGALRQTTEPGEISPEGPLQA